MVNKIKNIIKKRARYYLPMYLMGYLISIMNTGVPNIYYLIPIKLLAFLMALIGGNGIYYVAVEHEHFLFATVRIIKYVLATIVIIIFSATLEGSLHQYGIDISPFTSFDKPR